MAWCQDVQSHGFNSTLVRLSHSTPEKGCGTTWTIRFNSTLVRLSHSTPTDPAWVGCLYLFQFHSGSTKSLNDMRSLTTYPARTRSTSTLLRLSKSTKRTGRLG